MPVRKDPKLAVALCFINPLAAYFYVGRPGKGLLVLLVPSVSVFLLWLLISMASSNFSQTFFMILLMVAFGGSAIYSFADIPAIVEEINHNLDLILMENQRKNERSIYGDSDEKPATPEGGFERKVKGKVDYKPFDPIE